MRGTVPAQTTTGAFLTIRSSDEAKLVGARSPVAKTVEIHASEMKDGVMHMHAAESVRLPPGVEVKLQPGGYHVMMMGLEKRLGKGDRIPLVLTVEEKGGKRVEVEFFAVVRALGE